MWKPFFQRIVYLQICQIINVLVLYLDPWKSCCWSAFWVLIPIGPAWQSQWCCLDRRPESSGSCSERPTWCSHRALGQEECPGPKHRFVIKTEYWEYLSINQLSYKIYEELFEEQSDTRYIELQKLLDELCTYVTLHSIYEGLNLKKKYLTSSYIDSGYSYVVLIPESVHELIITKNSLQKKKSTPSLHKRMMSSCRSLLQDSWTSNTRGLPIALYPRGLDRASKSEKRGFLQSRDSDKGWNMGFL